MPDAVQPVVALFAKPPVPGAVKTRLSRAVGAAGAAALAGAFLEDAVALLGSVEGARVVVATTGRFAPPWDAVVASLPVWSQGDGDLGRRIERVIARGLSEGAPAAFVIGADVPGLPLPYLARAMDLAASHDAVLAPCPDGGFYLVGLRRCPAGIFDGIPWSAPETGERTAARLRSLGMTLAFAPPFGDVDEPADLARIAGELRDGRLAAPATARALRRLGLLE